MGSTLSGAIDRWPPAITAARGSPKKTSSSPTGRSMRTTSARRSEKHRAEGSRANSTQRDDPHASERAARRAVSALLALSAITLRQPRTRWRRTRCPPPGAPRQSQGRGARGRRTGPNACVQATSPQWDIAISRAEHGTLVAGACACVRPGHGVQHGISTTHPKPSPGLTLGIPPTRRRWRSRQTYPAHLASSSPAVSDTRLRMWVPDRRQKDGKR